MPDLSVVILSYNTRSIVDRCLRSLFDAALDIKLEVIIVDNGSSDGSVQYVRRYFPTVIVIANCQNVGFAAANNQGMARALAENILLLNSDAFIGPAALRRGLDTLRDQPSTGIVGVRLVNEDGTFQAGFGTFPSLWDDISRSVGIDQLARRARSAEPLVGSVDWIQGACMFVRRAAFEETGGLDNHFFMYSEEVDWCWRIRRRGWQVWYLGDVSVVHLGGGSSLGNDIGRRIALYRSRLSLRRRFGGPVSSSLLWLMMIAGLGLRIILRVIGQLVARRDLGRHSAATDWQLLQAVSKMDPLARRAVS